MLIEPAPEIGHVDFDNWMSKFTKFFNAREHRIYAPISMTVVAPDDDSETGTVADVQTAFDGNVLQVPEIAATPGIDVRFNFGNVDFQADTILMRLFYAGSATHYIGIEAYNYSTASFDSFTFFKDHVTDNFAWYQITIPNFDNYKGFEGGLDPTVVLRLNHYSGGVSSHDLYIDYVGLRV